MIETGRRIHVRALLLAVALVAAFVATTALYARYGYAVVLKTFEANQTARAESATGLRVSREYEDYLRVDPSSLMMRGLLINRLLEERKGPEAVEVAQRGVEIASGEDKPIAELLLARAKLGNGDLDEAEKAYVEILNALAAQGESYDDKLGNRGGAGGVSAESHYGLAHIYSARGEFALADAEFALCFRAQTRSHSYAILGFRFFSSRHDKTRNSSPDFARRAEAAAKSVTGSHFEADTQGIHSGDSWRHPLHRGYTSDDQFFKLALDSLLLGLDLSHMAKPALEAATDFVDAPLAAMFWRGVGEEQDGDLEEAMRFYRMAAEQRDPLAIAALERLGREKK